MIFNNVLVSIFKLVYIERVMVEYIIRIFIFVYILLNKKSAQIFSIYIIIIKELWECNFILKILI